MKRTRPADATIDPFEIVRVVGLSLRGVEAATKYDRSPVLRVRGCFMACLATHHSAERGTLVVRVGLEDRALLLEDAPDTYYVTEHYRRHPVVLVRLSRISVDALSDVLRVSWRLALEKARPRGRARGHAAPGHELDALAPRRGRRGIHEPPAK